MGHPLAREMMSKTIIRRYATQGTPRISATLLLSRNPVVTADLPEFETQYYKYQNNLWRRLMWTFPKWFYYREGTLSEQRFRELNKAPVFNNPNFEYTGGRPEIRQQRDRRFKQIVKVPKTYKETDLTSDEVGDSSEIDILSRKIVPNPRVTKADKEGDLASLERKLPRTLYLVVKEEGKWGFPNFLEESSGKLTPLHDLAEQGLTRIGGDKINYFNVAKTPCHLHNSTSKKEYFIKSHILSGEFLPQNSSLEHMWLTKEEVAQYLEKEYYEDIKHLLNNV